MATLAPPTPAALVWPCDSLSFGTGAHANGNDLHGQDFKALKQFVLGVRQRNAELAENFVAAEPAENFSYNTPPPLQSFYVKAVFRQGGEIPPVPFDFQED